MSCVWVTYGQSVCVSMSCVWVRYGQSVSSVCVCVCVCVFPLGTGASSGPVCV